MKLRSSNSGRIAAGGALAALLLAAAAPASAASQYDLPKEGTSIACAVSVLVPNAAFLVRCQDLLAGTLVPSNGGYTGALVCKHLNQGGKCQEIVMASVKAAALDIAKPLNCTVVGDSYDIQTFTCAQ